MNESFPIDHFLKVGRDSGQDKESPPLPTPLAPAQKERPTSNATEESSFGPTEKWEKELLEALKKSINPQKFEAYFAHTFKLESAHQSKITLSVATAFIRSIIENHYTMHLNEAISQVFQSSIPFVLNIDKSLNPASQNMLRQLPEKAATPKKNQSANNASFSLDLTPSHTDLNDKIESKYIQHVSTHSRPIQIDFKKTFDNFVVGPSNNMAYASCVAVGKNPGKTYPTIYIHSKSGLGKTHLLHAVGNVIHKDYPELKICITTAQYFLQEMVESIRTQKIEQFRKKYTEQVDVLMIDDIHELKNKQGTQNAFFHIFNDLYSKGKQLIFTSDKTPKEIDGIEERIKTRLSWGLVLDIQRPDLETRMAILKKKTHEEDAYLPDDVLHLIANCIKDNIRELEGSLIKLIAYSSIFKQDIDVETAKRELQLDEEEASEELTLEKIAKAISLYFKIPMADLKSKSRIKEVAFARHIGMFLSYKLLRTNYKDIGHFYGKRDHSTVIIGVRKVTSVLKSDPGVSRMVLDIENNL